MTVFQFPRKCSLILASATDTTDLSSLRVKFKVNQSDLQSPNNAIITVYNLADETSQKIQKEFTKVTLQAGYDGDGAPYGVIFAGTVRGYNRGNSSDKLQHVNPIRIGRETPTEKFLQINAGEGDDPYNFATISKTLSAGYDNTDVLNALNATTGTQLGEVPYQFGGNPNPRGKTMFGMSRDHLRTLTVPAGMRWSFINGKLQLISNTAYLQSEVVVLNSQTGLLGTPEQTPDGVICRALLNPKIQIGTNVKLNNADIVPAEFAPEFTAFNAPPPKSSDGTYRVLVAEYEGDTRGIQWWVNLTCVSVDPSSPIQTSVQPYSGG